MRKISKDIEQAELETFFIDDEPEVPPPDIIAYNELRSCADLYRLYKEGMLEIQPDFQREVVWQLNAQTRFIDSLIKQLPIPSMCFSLDNKKQKWLVIDGLQRMFTITKFLGGGDWTLSKLDDIDPRISGQHISKFTHKGADLHELYTRVENLTLPITVLRCDYEKKSHTDYLFTIFHRLNSGGMKLNNQEIRNAIYSGSLNDLLKELNANPLWMKLNRMQQVEGYRFAKEEIILRLLAFHDKFEKYNGRLAKFLNTYMESNRNLSKEELAKKRLVFDRTVRIIAEKVFQEKYPAKISVTILEALLVGISLNLDYLENMSSKQINRMFERLQAREELSDEKLREGLAGRTRVIERFRAAKEVFSGVA